MPRKIIILFIVFMLFPAHAFGAINVTETDDLSFDIYTGTFEEPKSDKELVNVKYVTDEVYQLTKTLPVLNQVDAKIYITNKRFKKPDIGWIDGTTFINKNNIILFASMVYTVKVEEDGIAIPYDVYKASSTTAHEIGHMVKNIFISNSDFEEYIKTRNPDSKPADDYFDAPREIFAEDIRWLFGSDNARQIPYRPDLLPPGEKEREWILNKIQKAVENRVYSNQ